MLDLNSEELSLLENIKSRKWRLENLYFIKDKHGKKIPFKMNWAQQQILDNFWYFTIILKARQLGITTFFCILYLDAVLFNENKTAVIIAHKQEDAKKFFADKVKFAWDNLPPILQDLLGPPNTDSANELSFPNGSKISVTTGARGSTVQYLHISEFGKICALYPAKAKEIVTGSINAVEQGNFVSIESTAEGRSGYFFEYCQEAEKIAKEKRILSPLDFKFFFFPWWQEPTYRLQSNFLIKQEYHDYFRSLRDKYNILLDDEQKRWYIAKREKNKEDMTREYPSTPEEAFLASIEGAYYSQQLSYIYENNRIREVPYDARYPVDTWWDLGMNDLNVILFTQAVGNEIRFIDVYYNRGEGLAHYVNKLREKPYTYGKHTFPHDIEVRNLDEKGQSRRQTLRDLGLYNVRTIEKTKNINDDIEAVRRLFSRFYFDEEKTKVLVEAIQNYSKEWDDKLGQYKSYPKHDKHSHLVDPLRLLARGWMDHMIDPNAPGIRNPQFESFF